MRDSIPFSYPLLGTFLSPSELTHTALNASDSYKDYSKDILELFDTIPKEVVNGP